MYSSDRYNQLEKTLLFLREMELYEECQKILVVDRMTNFAPEDFEICPVNRIDEEFVWANMWQAGVDAARFDNILYLDSDRLLPRNYLKLVSETLVENCFVFSSNHFSITGEISDDACRTLLNSSFEEGLFGNDEFCGKIRYEPRSEHIVHGPGKNVMSGNTAFKKSTYIKLGGVDPWYRGHGAYADSDLHMKAFHAGCIFKDLQTIELHCPHEKKNDFGCSLSAYEIGCLGLNNFIYYCKKWNLPIELAEQLAIRCKVSNPVAYVASMVKKYAKGSF